MNLFRGENKGNSICQLKTSISFCRATLWFNLDFCNFCFCTHGFSLPNSLLFIVDKSSEHDSYPMQMFSGCRGSVLSFCVLNSQLYLHIAAPVERCGCTHHYPSVFMYFIQSQPSWAWDAVTVHVQNSVGNLLW